MLRILDCYDIANITDIPPNAQIIPTKMDLKEKKDSNNKRIKDKPRLVVLGSLEWATERDVFSPSANLSTPIFSSTS